MSEKADFEIKETLSGKHWATFTDNLGRHCAVVETMHVTSRHNALKLGRNNCMMFLTQDMVEKLLPMLIAFEATGRIVESKSPRDTLTAFEYRKLWQSFSEDMEAAGWHFRLTSVDWFRPWTLRDGENATTGTTNVLDGNAFDFWRSTGKVPDVYGGSLEKQRGADEKQD